MYKILPYYGYGNNDSVIFRGRVVHDNGYEEYKNRTGFWNSLIGFWKRFAIKPVASQNVDVTFESNTKTVVTDPYGVFTAQFNPADQTDDKWLVANASIQLGNKQIVAANITSINDVSGNRFGIISDIDDTVLISKATKKIELVYLTVFKKPSQRLAFDGVADSYNQLVAGKRDETNPIFYVSSSHWNLFDLLNDFLELNKFPKGPLLLKCVKGVKDTLLSIGNHDHKKQKIVEVLETYPKLAFVLIGDSGQHDAAIYANLARQYPDRIQTILIRDVTNYDDPLVKAAAEIVPETTSFHTFTTSGELDQICRTLELIN